MSVVEITEYEPDTELKYKLRYKACKGCIHLNQITYDTQKCEKLMHSDGSSVYPMLNGEHTCDWGYCCGQHYEESGEKIVEFKRR